jgi:lipopolysaccharide export system permease protein
VTRIDRYVIEKTMIPLAATIGIALAALLMERMVRLMEILVSQGGPLFLVLKMLGNLVPHYLGLALPAALFVGVMLATTRLSIDSEIDALQSVGVSLRRLLRPLMMLTFGIAIVLFLLYGYLQPYTRYAYRALMYAATNSAWDLSLEKGSFFTGLGGYTVLVDDIADGGRKLYGVFVYKKDDTGTTIAMTAESGEASRRPEQLQIVLHLIKGVRSEIKPDGQVTVLTFDDFDMPIDVALPEPFRDRVGERELTMDELWDQRNTDKVKPSKYAIRAEFWGRIVRTVSLLMLPFLGIPLGLATRRNQRNLGIAIGVITLVIYNNVLNFGEQLASAGRLTSFVGLWLPFLLFSTVSVWLFLTVSARPRENPVAMLIGSLDRAKDWLLQWIPRRTRPSAAE